MSKVLPKPPINAWRPVKAKPLDYFSKEEVDKSKRYIRPLQYAAIAGMIINWIALALFIAFDGPRFLINLFGSPSWPLQIVIVAAGVTLVQILVSLPLEIWSEFVHEKKWGFSKQTLALFAKDGLKGFILGMVVNSALFIPLWAVIRATDLWWVWGVLVVFSLSLIFNFIYPTVIMPIFNKFTPLEDEELKAKLNALADKAGATITAFHVMDASRRTTRDNAAVAGIGKNKRVIVFDNLLQHPHESVEVVVAHELGHFRRGHIRNQLLMLPILTILQFGLIKVLTEWPPILNFAGVKSLGDPAALPLFMLLFTVVSYVMTFLNSFLARKNEREADFDALELTGNVDAYTELWRKFSDKNLPDLDPSVWDRVRSSHPPLAERMAFAEVWKRSAGNASG